jgi:hypothetical protein
MQTIDISVMTETLYSVDEITDIERVEEEAEELEEDRVEESEDEEEEKPSSKTYEENVPTYPEKYNRKFKLPLSGVYMDDEEGCMKIEYDVFYEEIRPEEYEKIVPESNIKDPQYQPEFDLLLGATTEKYTESISANEHMGDSAYYRPEVLNIEYEKPELINGQKTYQRIVFKAEADGESVYEISMKKLSEAGIEISAEYDSEFSSMIFTSINGRSEGDEGNFNEFYLNGEIGGNAVDKEILKAGDVVEWRYAEENDGSCGGVPDFTKIKSMMEYGMAFQAYATLLGVGNEISPFRRETIYRYAA